MTVGRSDLPQQPVMPQNCATPAVLPVMFVTPNTVYPAQTLAGWPVTVVPQSTVIQPGMPVQQASHSADIRQISLQDFRNEVGKKLQFR